MDIASEEYNFRLQNQISILSALDMCFLHTWYLRDSHDNPAETKVVYTDTSHGKYVHFPLSFRMI